MCGSIPTVIYSVKCRLISIYIHILYCTVTFTCAYINSYSCHTCMYIYIYTPACFIYKHKLPELWGVVCSEQITRNNNAKGTGFVDYNNLRITQGNNKKNILYAMDLWFHIPYAMVVWVQYCHV